MDVELLDRSASQAGWMPLDMGRSNRRPFGAARLAPAIDSGFAELLWWFRWDPRWSKKRIVDMEDGDQYQQKLDDIQLCFTAHFT